MTENIKVLIVEDEMIIAEDMKSMLCQKYTVTGIAINYAEAVESLHMRLPDIVMIDINLLGAKTGIQLAHHINKTLGIPFIFATSLADDDTIEEAKATHPYAYLIKPFERRSLFSAIEIALSNAKSSKFIEEKPESNNFRNIFKDVFFVKKEHYYVKIKAEDIQYISADGNYLDIVCKGEKFIIRSTLKAFTEQLNATLFLQVHKSHVINLQEIKAVAYDHVLINNEKIPLSKTGRDELLLITNRLS